MGPRREDESGIADDRLKRPGQQEDDEPAAPADAAKVAKPVAQHDRQQHQPGPDEAMERDVGGRQPGRESARNRDEARGPEQCRAGAAKDPDGEPRLDRSGGRRVRRGHGALG
jgi:hypothetical protein